NRRFMRVLPSYSFEHIKTHFHAILLVFAATMWQRYGRETTQNQGSRIQRQQSSASEIRGELSRSRKTEAQFFRNGSPGKIIRRAQECRVSKKRHRARRISNGAARHGTGVQGYTERLR